MNNSNQQFTKLEQAIVKTIAYFDIFDYPLTAVEVHKWLYLPRSENRANYQLVDILSALASQALAEIIKNQNGFYFLTGRSEIITSRLSHYYLAEKKFKIALKVVKKLRYLAFIKMIAVCNTLGYNNAAKNSDIDFFIIIKNNRLWWSRLIIILITTLLGVRRHNQKVTNRICLSFYISDGYLDLSSITLKPQDSHLAFWLTGFAPIYDLEVYQSFLSANQWFNDCFPNFYPPAMNNRRSVKDSGFVRIVKKIELLILAGSFGNQLEKMARYLQLPKLRSYLGSETNEPNHNVVVSSEMLKFHKVDRREKYQNLWQEKLNNLNLTIGPS